MLSSTPGATPWCDSLSSVLPSFLACFVDTVGLKIEADGDGFAMNFAAFITNLKSDLTRFYAKESVLNNELRRIPIRRSSANRVSAKFALMEFSEVRVR